MTNVRPGETGRAATAFRESLVYLRAHSPVGSGYWKPNASENSTSQPSSCGRQHDPVFDWQNWLSTTALPHLLKHGFDICLCGLEVFWPCVHERVLDDRLREGWEILLLGSVD